MQKNPELATAYMQSLQNQKAFVVYSLAGGKKIEHISSANYAFLNSLPDNLEDGFIIHPFKVSDSSPIIWISKKEGSSKPGASRHAALSMQNLNHDQAKYTAFVRGIQNHISEGHIQKAVASRPFFADVKPDWNPIDYFQKLTEKYENAFTYLFSIPGIGIWCGATPELLVDAQNKAVNLVSLAGTKKPSDDWTSKELEEQKIVTKYIESLLQRNGCQNIDSGKTKTINAGAVDHLETKFTVELNHPQQVFSLVKDLHPTPAVGGIPKSAAIEIILENEAYDRKYYTGYLGPVSADRATLYVNLRCLEVLGESVCLYIGAGITAASDPKAEWLETQLKAKTLLSVLEE